MSGWARVLRAPAAALLLLPLGASIALAHPLGNFTVNHYAGIRVEPDRVLLDVVIDQAEIPTFQALMDLDQDGDGEFSDEELLAAERGGCTTIGEALALTVGGTALPVTLFEAGISFPPGNGGLSTMREVCTFEARLATPFDGSTRVELRDSFEPSRLGWREMTVAGSGVTVSGDGLVAASTSDRLLTYPAGLSGAPDVRAVAFTVAPGGPTLPPFAVPDADPIVPVVIGTVVAPPSGSEPATEEPGPSAVPVAVVVPPASAAASSAVDAAASTGAPGSGAVPGGEGAIPDILRTLPVSPALALLSLVTAALLGIGHALTPGHGKTLMAAYLVGTRGTPRHALGLGAAVSISHTLGILGLAVVVIGAEAALPPDLVVRIAPIAAALTIVAIGGWMLATEIRRTRATRRETPAVGAAHALGQSGDGGHEEEHEHGGVRHRHLPSRSTTVTWRSLFILGLAGGLIPSTNALLILLATIAAGQPAWGVVLVIAFGLGMAAVMTGVGLAFVHARGLLERRTSPTGLGRVARLVPLGAAVLVLSVGVVLTTQALSAAKLG